MTGKRYNNANLNSLFDKPPGQGSSSNSGSGVMHRGMLILQGHRASQRSRLAPHPSQGKLAIPKPVNLPSLRKENQGNDPNTQLVPAPGGSGSWHKVEDHQAGVESGHPQSLLGARGSGAWQTSSGGGGSGGVSGLADSGTGSSGGPVAGGTDGAGNGSGSGPVGAGSTRGQTQAGSSGANPPQGGGSGGNGPERQSSQFLNQEEYPTLEAATHNKPVTKGKKPEKSPTGSGELPKKEVSGDWSEDDRHSQRRSWYEDERLAPSESYGYSSWGDTEYRPPPYGNRGPYPSQHSPYYGHGQGMYGVPPDSAQGHSGYYEGRGMAPPYPDHHHREPSYHGHYPPPYVSGGHYHHDYRPGYEYGGDPYMDRSLFPPPPPPPPPPPKDADEQGSHDHHNEGRDPEREEYDAELKKRAMELGAKMKSDSEGASQLVTPAGQPPSDPRPDGRVKLVRRPSGVPQDTESRLAQLPGDDRPSDLPSGSSSQVDQSEEHKGGSSSPTSQEPTQPVPRVDSLEAPFLRREGSPRGWKDLDWEAQVDAEEKANAARRERALRDAQMRLEPPTLLKPAQRGGREPLRKGAEVQTRDTPSRLPPRRGVETQSIGIQAQPPAPPPPLQTTPRSQNDRVPQGGTVVQDEKESQGSLVMEGGAGKPGVPGPWGQRPPASVQAQRQAQSIMQTPPPPPPPRQMYSAESGVQSGDGSAAHQTPPAVNQSHDGSFGRGPPEYDRDVRGRRDDSRHRRDVHIERGGRGPRGRGRRGRGGGRYESRADQQDNWRQPRDVEAKHHLGKMRSDYMGREGGRSGPPSVEHVTPRSDRTRRDPHGSIPVHPSPQTHIPPINTGTMNTEPVHPSGNQPHPGPYSQGSSTGHVLGRQDSRGSSVGPAFSRQDSRESSHGHGYSQPSSQTSSVHGDHHAHRDRFHHVSGHRGGGPARGQRQDRKPRDEYRPGRGEGHRRPRGGGPGRDRDREHYHQTSDGYREQNQQGRHSNAPPRPMPSRDASDGVSTGHWDGPPARNVVSVDSGRAPAHYRQPVVTERPVQQAPPHQSGQQGRPQRGPVQRVIETEPQRSVPPAQQPVPAGPPADTPIQFGQFHMKSILSGMPGNTFALPDHIGDLNIHQVHGTNRPSGSAARPADEIGTTGQGVQCLPKNLMQDSSPKDVSSHRALQSPAPISANPASAASLPENLLDNPPQENVSRSQGHIHEHSSRGRGRRGGGRGGRGRGGRSGFQQERSDIRSDVLHGPGRGEGGRGRSDGYRQGKHDSGRGRGDGYRQGRGGTVARGPGRGDGFRHERSESSGRGSGRGEGGRGRNMGRGAGRGDRGRRSGHADGGSGAAVKEQEQEQHRERTPRNAVNDEPSTTQTTEPPETTLEARAETSGGIGRGGGRGGRGERNERGRGRGGRDGGRGDRGRGRRDGPGRGRGAFRGRGRGRGGGGGDSNSSGNRVRQEWIPKASADSKAET